MEGVTDLRSLHAGCDTQVFHSLKRSEGERGTERQSEAIHFNHLLQQGTKEKIIVNQWYKNKRVHFDGKWVLYDKNW